MYALFCCPEQYLSEIEWLPIIIPTGASFGARVIWCFRLLYLPTNKQVFGAGLRHLQTVVDPQYKTY
jgi:hypothetical protein